jgi:rhamnose transport system permease protein
MRGHREISVALAILLLGLFLAAVTPGYFARDNLIDVFLANLPVLMVALGMTLVIILGHIDISVGSIFAICGVAAGLTAKSGLPLVMTGLTACAVGALLGAINGALVGYVRLPSIVVTLATMVAWRDALRWSTQGAWVQDLPTGFQWLGVGQSAYPLVAAALALGLFVAIAWSMRNLRIGRAIYATGSNPDAARLAGLNPAFLSCAVFVITGAMTGFAALVNSVRFNQIPSNAGIGMEMKVIAAVVVGGAAIRGGRASFTGTVLGVVLLGAIGPALTFLGVSAYWERALQGAIILAAVTADAVGRRGIAVARGRLTRGLVR